MSEPQIPATAAAAELKWYLHGALIAYPPDRQEAILAGAMEYAAKIVAEAAAPQPAAETVALLLADLDEAMDRIAKRQHTSEDYKAGWLDGLKAIRDDIADYGLPALDATPAPASSGLDWRYRLLKADPECPCHPCEELRGLARLRDTGASNEQ